MLHLCTGKRAEIVQFGPDAKFVPPFAFESNGYTVTAHKADDDHCFVSLVPEGTASRFQVYLFAQGLRCAAPAVPNGRDVVQEVVEILLDAGNGKKLNCPVAEDALPEVPSVEALAASHRGSDGLLELAGQELGETPTLYERAAPKPLPRNRDADTSRQPQSEETIQPRQDKTIPGNQFN